ncbi:uncharacterized protein LOC123218732 isoform X2 [Mangifera indica]|uniref:uncharacterized protein LOC123218732 isoform X2 n=1 Tax=Mangifera indica TaxID=29780 RepID=UPI001CF995D8|nr:uncharacterized protein LOC123218732 isoform X2 [Mangifera indica]
MSKKKAFTGNTMTLKDFHGGSIPSDLPLPSAPGVPMDRSGYDRSTSWGNPITRSDHRPRPNSSPATRHFDDKTPFLANAVQIGRNFEEDERKPLDGVSAPRRTVSDDSFSVPTSRMELKPESVSTGRMPGWARLGLGSQVSNGGQVVEQTRVDVNSPNSRGNSGQMVPGSHPNAWTARKEMAMGVTEPVQSGWSGQSAVSKLAHASALEKVSSGRWRSKQSVQYQADVQVIKFSVTDNGSHPTGHEDNAYNRMHVVGRSEWSDATLAGHVERGSNIEESLQGGRKEELDYGRSGASTYVDVKERKYKHFTDRAQSSSSDSKFIGPESLPLLQSEASERPKLKLLPRSRPLENSEPNVANPKQVYPHLNESGHGHVETVSSVLGNLNPSNPDLAGSDVGSHAVERQKLSLKPWSQPPEQLEENIQRGRNALFGGARPRELVLKERGIDDVAINNQDLGQHSDRGKHNNIGKFERAPEHANPTRQSGRVENLPLDQRMGRKFERKDPHIDVDRVGVQRRNWRNENRRNNRGIEREQNQQQHERHSSPETWRKPVEQPKPLSADAIGMRYGKVASAVELAQAFSRSFSDPKSDDRYSGQRGLTGRTQMPFSRLMGPTPRAQINGY